MNARDDAPARSEALSLINSGMKIGAFNFCNEETFALVSFCATGLLEGLVVQKLTGLTAVTYLLFFPELRSMKGLVIKVFRAKSAKLLAKAEKEAEFFKQARPQTSTYVLPRHLATFTLFEQAVFVTELLPGTKVTDTVVDRYAAQRFCAAIRYTQELISFTSVGSKIAAEAQASLFRANAKLAKHVKQYFGIILDRKGFEFLDSLDTLRESCNAIVSDRSPTNFLVNNEQIGAFDFEIMFPGAPFEDWSWFIDDPRLVSSLSRQELVSIFCKDFATMSGQDESELTHHFHLSAFYVCIKQCCFMLAMGAQQMGAHYLSRANQSAQVLSLKEAVNLTESMRAVLLPMLSENRTETHFC